jgi:ribonuclease P protein component
MRRRPTPPRRSGPGRLSRSADFERAYRRGHSAANRYLVLYVFPRAPGDEPRLGVSVSRRLGGAVVRNRVKRLLREAFRATSELAGGRDYVAVARPDAAELAEREGFSGIQRALHDVLRTLGDPPAGGSGGLAPEDSWEPAS